jgi:hypothetical protein
MPVGDLMQLEAQGLPWGTTAVVVTGITDAPLTAGVVRLLDAGHTVVAILVGDEADPSALPVPAYRVPAIRGWQALEGLTFEAAEVALTAGPASGPGGGRR